MRLSFTIFFRISLTSLILALVLTTALFAEQTVGLFQYSEQSYDGYTLFAPMSSTMTYLIDNYGRVVHSWDSDYRPNSVVYLLENGNLLRTAYIPGSGNSQGGMEILDWDGNTVWQFQYSGADYFPHHDIELLPNGNILMIARETKSYAEAIAAGRNPSLLVQSTLEPEYVIEVSPTGPTSGEIVWEWHVWDHIVQDYDISKDNYGVVAEHPELLDLNFALNGRSDWNHVNSIDYNPELDQIILSCHQLSEFWVIDHSTTTAEAGSHAGGNGGRGGDFLYRWGNPQAYDAGTAADQQLFVQHDPHWIADELPGAGHILIYNNGTGRPGGNFSTIDEIIPPLDSNGLYEWPGIGQPYGPDNYTWRYQAETPGDFYSALISGCERLPNNNTLICSGPTGRFFEVTTDGEIVWEYKSPVTIFGIASQGDAIPPTYNNVFRCYRYGPDFPGLAGRDLTPGGPLELYPILISGVVHSPVNPAASDSIIITAKIESDHDILTTELYVDAGSGYNAYQLYDDGLHQDGLSGDDMYGAVLPPFYSTGNVSYYVLAEDVSAGHLTDPPIAPAVTYTIQMASTNFVCGDANGDLNVNVSDAVYIINFVFMGGAEPLPYNSADANCDTSVNVSDAVYLINYVFTSGNYPCDPNGDMIPDC